MGLRGSLSDKIYFLRNPDRALSFHKTLFSKASLIASKVDWGVKYAYYKPSKPSIEQVINFEKAVQTIKYQLDFLKKNYKPQDPKLLEIIEEKLNNIVEEYKNYPFSDRDVFFNARLKFIQSILKKCFIENYIKH
jgi:hypothetical protein